MNILILSVGTRNLLVSYFMKSKFDKVIVTDVSELAPALYGASSYHIVPRMTDPTYLSSIEKICDDEKIDVILPLHEDELFLISQNRKRFEDKGIMVVVSEYATIDLCRDKYAFYQLMKKNNIPVLRTYLNVTDFEKAYNNNEIDFPVFLKPRLGAGSVHSFSANNMGFVKAVYENYNEDFIVQEFNNGNEYGVDIYVDFLSKKVTSIFIKKKLRMRAGETEKSVSIRNETIKQLVLKVINLFDCYGPIDMDLFEINGKIYVSEINPRFGGGYPHAYLSGINFPEYIFNNAKKIENPVLLENYKEGIIALKTQNIRII